MATYYMRADGTAANKAAATGPTTSQSACMNISVHNGTTFSNGDIISVSDKGGIYTSQLVPPSSGSSGNGITYIAATGETPIFDYSRKLTSWSGPDGNGAYYKTMASSPALMLYDNGVPVGVPSSTAACANNDHWFQSGTTVYYKPTYGSPNTHTTGYILNEFYQCIAIAGRSYITIDGLTFQCSAEGIYGNVTNAQSNLVVRNCTFNYCFIGFDIYPEAAVTYCTLTNNTFYRCHSAIQVYGNYCDHWTVTNNIATDIGTYDGVAGHYYYINNGYDDKDFIGFQNVSNSTISGNVAHGGAYIGIVLWCNNGYTNTNNNIYNNAFFNTINGGIYITGDASGGATYGYSGNYIYNNLLINTVDTGGYSGFAFHFINGTGTSAMNYVNNNTIYSSGVGGGVFIDTFSTQQLTFKNNIIYPANSTYTFEWDDSAANLVIDYNLVYPDSKYRGLGSTYTMAQIQSGFQAHGLNTNPLFVNAGGTTPSDYVLQTNSVAKWAGVAVGLSIDYDGTNYHSPPSIGAMEYVTEEETMADPTYIAGELLATGNACKYNSLGKLVKATSPDPVVAIVEVGGAADVTVTCYPAGRITYGSWTSANLPLFLSGSTPGLITLTPSRRQIGYTASTTNIWWEPEVQDQSISQVYGYNSSTLVATRRGFNFIQGANITLNIADNPSYDVVDVGITSSGGGGGGGPYIDVKVNYGAVGNDSTNDTTAIQNAINAANAAGGGTVWIPKGTYKITSPLTLYSKVTVCGVRGASILKMYPSTSTCWTFYIGAELSFITVQDLILDFVTTSYAGYGGFELVGPISDLLIENVEAKNYEYYAIRGTSVSGQPITRMTVRNCYFHDTSHMGICVKNMTDTLIDGNVFYKMGSSQLDHSIYESESCNNLRIVNNVFKEANGCVINNGAISTINGYKLTIANNIMLNPKYLMPLVEMANIYDATISGNVAQILSTDSYSGLVWCWNSCYRISVTGNTIYSELVGTGYRGFISLIGRYLTASGNNIFYNGADAGTVGIDVGSQYYGGDAQDVLVTGNNVENCGIGIDVYNYGGKTISGIQVTGNKCRGQGAAGHGVRIAGIARNVMVMNNVLQGFTNGLYTTSANASDILFSYNIYTNGKTQYSNAGGTPTRFTATGNVAVGP